MAVVEALLAAGAATWPADVAGNTPLRRRFVAAWRWGGRGALLAAGAPTLTYRSLAA